MFQIRKYRNSKVDEGGGDIKRSTGQVSQWM
jgi:hypothetical protein